MVIVPLSLLLLFGGKGGLHLSPIELAALPYHYDLVTWEIGNAPDKWLYKLKSFLPWKSRSHDDRLQDVREFFRLGQEIRRLERDLETPDAQRSQEDNSGSSQAARSRDEREAQVRRLRELRSKRSGLKAGVEETLESEISAVVTREGLSFRIGIVFPPVDVALVGPPRVLIISPRDRIDRIKTLLLEANMGVDDMETLEDKILEEQDVTALVVDIGGVATYPTIVRDDSSLRGAAVTAAHEWLHIYWFFRPLGWNLWSSSEMNTLNETAASLAGRELGLRVYEAITGEKVAEAPRPGPASTGDAPAEEDPEEEGFDFSREMRKTRLRVDELLAGERVEDAESYMEERRQMFVENGFYIRKLNQAYFAFHGTYASSPASVSPIGGEVELLRGMTDSIGEFIKTMAGFGSYQEFLDYLSGTSAEAGSESGGGRALNLVH